MICKTVRHSRSISSSAERQAAIALAREQCLRVHQRGSDGGHCARQAKRGGRARAAEAFFIVVRNLDHHARGPPEQLAPPGYLRCVGRGIETARRLGWHVLETGRRRWRTPAVERNDGSAIDSIPSCCRIPRLGLRATARRSRSARSAPPTSSSRESSSKPFVRGAALAAGCSRALLAVARQEGVRRIVGIALSTNDGMLTLARRLGFKLAPDPSSATITTLTLDLS